MEDHLHARSVWVPSAQGAGEGVQAGDVGFVGMLVLDISFVGILAAAAAAAAESASPSAERPVVLRDVVEPEDGRGFVPDLLVGGEEGEEGMDGRDLSVFGRGCEG